MAISLLSSTPAHGAVDFFINKSIELTFDKDIATASLSPNVFSLIDIESGTVVPVTVSVDYSTSTIVKLLPGTHLKEDTQYRVIIVGTDQGLSYSLVATDLDTLTTSIAIEFSTGSTVYIIDSTIQKEAASLTLEGDIFLPSNVKALGYDFTVSKVRPKNNIHGVSVDLTGDSTVRFTFSKPLYTGQDDYTEWVDVTTFPLLDETAWLASGDTLGAVPMPSYSVSVSDTDLIVTFDSYLPKNAGVHIDLYNTITSEDGDVFSGNLHYSINTELFPNIYGVQTIKREVKDIADTFTEDYIGALLFKNSIWAWEKCGRSFSLSGPSYAAKQYIVYTTILDLMEDREYYKYVVAGTRRQLGDLGVSIDNIIGRVAMKVAKYQKAKEDAYQSILGNWQFRVGGNQLAYQEVAADINRLWYNVNGRYTDSRYRYHQTDIPAANYTINRGSKTNNPIW